jgi:hypothetical protein
MSILNINLYPAYCDYLMGLFQLHQIFSNIDFSEYDIVNYNLIDDLVISIQCNGIISMTLKYKIYQYQATIKYKAKSLCTIIFENDKNSGSFISRDFFANKLCGISTLPCEIFMNHEKFLNDLGIYYCNYFEGQVLEGNVHLKIKIPLNFIARNTIISITSNNLLSSFANIESPIVKIKLSDPQEFIEQLLDYSNDTLEYLMIEIKLEEDVYSNHRLNKRVQAYIESNDLRKILVRNFPALLSVTVNDCYFFNDSSLNAFECKLIRDIYYTFKNVGAENITTYAGTGLVSGNNLVKSANKI